MKKGLLWGRRSPGISFRADCGRITIYRTTLTALGFPEYYRFLFNTRDRLFAMQSCSIDDEGAHRLPNIEKDDTCLITSKAMVTFIYRTCGWEGRMTYRVPGEYCPREGLVSFQLSEAFALQQDR